MLYTLENTEGENIKDRIKKMYKRILEKMPFQIEDTIVTFCFSELTSISVE